MGYSEEMLKNIAKIYKYVYQHPGVHRNIVRKELLSKGKISSKEKFYLALEGLISLGRLKMEKENLTISPEIVEYGVLNKEGETYYLISPTHKKRFAVPKSSVEGFQVGTIFSIIVESGPNAKQAIILGQINKDKQHISEVKVEVENARQKPVQRDENLLLGRVVKLSHDELIFIPNKKSIPVRQIPILNAKQDQAAFQDKICIMRVEDLDAPLLGGYITEVKGDAGNPVHEYDAIAENYGAIMSWEGEALSKEIAKIPTAVNVSSLDLIDEDQAIRLSQRGKVVDLRNINIKTIDPTRAMDLDDGIFETIDKSGNIVCYTAVANVTKYVDLDSIIGQNYVKGGFTIYAPNKAYNILPTKLSTGICSLNPNEDRLAFVVKTTIDRKTGKVLHSNIFDAIIRSSQKYSYEQAQSIVDSMPDVTMDSLCEKISQGKALSDDEQILMNFYAAEVIKIGFQNRQMIRFVSNDEREIVFNQDMQDVIDIKAIPHLQYHEVIEAFMITANEATAKYAKDHGLDNIYRVHDEPSNRKLTRANEFFSILGIDFEGDLSAQGTINLIDLIRGSANEEVINKFLIKMQSRAVYSDQLYPEEKREDLEWLGERISHYALQSPHYSHTTSPIRRVPDFVTQYNILAHMHGTQPLTAERIAEIVEIANERQLEIDQAEKDFEDISSVIYCEKHIGEKMHGRITKMRYCLPEEGYEDEIIVVVKSDDKGIVAEIPLSQILGRKTSDCSLSAQHCAVYDGRGDVVLTLCKPIDFEIARADRKTMTIEGRTNKVMARTAEIRQEMHARRYKRDQHRRDTRRKDDAGKTDRRTQKVYGQDESENEQL